MSDTDHSKAWLYVHGQMGDDERRAFESALASDAGLQTEVRRARALDRRLRALMPYSDANWEALEEKALREWEASQVSAPRPAWWRVVQEWMKPAPVLRLAAALASVLLLAGAYHILSASLVLEGPQVLEGPVYRGEGAPPPLYSRDQLASWGSDVGAEVQASYDRAREGRGLWYRLASKRRWALRVEIRELPTGAVSFRLIARDRRAEGTAHEWTFLLPKGGAFETAVDAWSSRIGTELESMERGETAVPATPPPSPNHGVKGDQHEYDGSRTKVV